MIEPRYSGRVFDARRRLAGVAANGAKCAVDVARCLEKTLCGLGFPGMRDRRHGRCSSVAGYDKPIASARIARCASA
ncbi:hypothetical protein C7S16_6734 [Burkholderia thailandensis]|uniref:Uncharacterized protein n=1 Tax=Burkholderia thailandensis TaxID=57975 RepID=A0AAW9CP30_BURTH|nr:hypothetical protein [Burkholderia thailandensis]